ncbi:MAG: glycogen phosphorylase, partial [Syntrophobacterales bacterium]
GPENFFLFGLAVEEVVELKARGYNPMGAYQSNDELREAIDRIASGHFSRGDGNLFKPLVDSLLYKDEYLLLADYASYLDYQDRVGEAFRDQQRWTRMSILNTARSGKFSSDRSIRDYCERIWKVKPVQVDLE